MPLTELSPHPVDLVSPGFTSNPYPAYKHLLGNEPFYYCADRRLYYVARHELVKTLFRDPRASSNRVAPMAAALPEPVREFASPVLKCLEKWVLFLDPPRHGQLRKIISPAFTSKVISNLEPKISGIANTLVKDMKHSGRCDLVADFAYPLPVMVIADMLGCPASDYKLIKVWSDHIADFLGSKTTLEKATNIRTSILQATQYFEDIVREQKRKPKENLLQNMIEFQGQEKSFSDDHLVANSIALLFAGHETTSNLISNAVYCLHQNPEYGRHFIEASDFSGSLLDACIEETLRLESPVQRMGRFSTEDIELEGEIIEQGHRIILMLGAANRDPRVFSDPDRYWPERPEREHFAFGYGHHFCSGAMLARTEARIALHTLFSGAIIPILDGIEFDWHTNVALRALRKFPIHIQAT